MKRSVLIPILVALLLAAFVVPAALAAPSADTVIEAGQVVNNDVVVLDGDLEIGQGAVVNGDVAVFNGDAAVDGRINGSLTIFNGDLEAGPEAAISGQCVLLNGDVQGDGAPGNCTAIKNFEMAPLGKLAPNWFNAPMPTMPAMPDMPVMPEMPDMPAMPEMPTAPIMPDVPPVPLPTDVRGEGMSAVARGFSTLFSTAAFAFIGWLVAAIMPNQLREIVGAARRKPVASGAAGILTAIAVPSLIVLLVPLSIILTFVCIGLLGFPIMILLAIGLVLGMILGWVTMGTWLGLRLFGGKEQRLMRSAVLGTATLTFVMGMLGFMPFLFGETLLAFVIGAIGLGAVALTQFGTKRYPRLSQPGEPGDGEDAGKLDTVLQTLPPDEAAAGQGI